MMKLRLGFFARVGFTGVACVSLVACGSGGEKRSSGALIGDESALVATITLAEPEALAGTASISLSWHGEGPIAEYQVLVRATATSEYATVASGVTGESTAMDRGPAWLLDWPTAAVKVRGCDAAGECVDSNEQPLAEALLATVATLGPPQDGPGLFSIATALSADGSTLAVNAHAEPVSGSATWQAAAYVFRRSAAGTWTLEQRIQGTRGSFGAQIALNATGDTLALPAPDDTFPGGGINPLPDSCPPGELGALQGAVHVYVRTAPGTWTEQAYIKSEFASDELYPGSFGTPIVLGRDGNWLSVGSEVPRRGPETDIYLRDSSGTWSRAAHLTNADLGGTIDAAAVQVRVSAPLGVSGNTRVFATAATYITYLSEIDEWVGWSAVHVYRQIPNAAGWALDGVLQSAKQRPMPIPGDEGDNFGRSPVLDYEGDVVAVGAPTDSSDSSDTVGNPANVGAESSGAAYVFARTGAGVWQRRAFLKARDARPWDNFARNLQLSADGRVLAGDARGKSANVAGVHRNHAEGSVTGAPDESYWGGSVYVFTQTEDGSWVHSAAVVPPSPLNVSWDFFSFAMTDDAKTLALGARSYTAAGSTGRAYVY